MLTAAPGDMPVVWQTSDGAELHKLTLADGNPLPTQAEFMDDGKHVVINVLKSAKTPDAGSFLGIWDVATGKVTTSLLANTLVKSMRFSPDQQRLFVTASDGSTHVFELSTKAQVDALTGAELIGFSSDGRRLIAHDGDGIRLYDAHTLSPVSRTPGQITAFIGPKAGNLYATVAADGSVKLLNFESGEAVSTLKGGHIDPVSMVSFAPDGKQLVTFSDDKVAKLWALPAVRDVSKLLKDSFESTTEYKKRVADWSSDYTTLVSLGEYDADTESYTVKVGSVEIKVPMARDDARQFAGQREAILSGRLKFYDTDKLQLAEYKLSRIP
jgi:WD40 repeat protein